MNVLFIILVLEVVFLLTTIPIFLAFFRLQKMQESFFQALHNAPTIRVRHTLIVVSYSIMTIVLCVATFMYSVYYF